MQILHYLKLQKKVVGTLEDGLPDDGIPRFTTESKKQIDETVESEK